MMYTIIQIRSERTKNTIQIENNYLVNLNHVSVITLKINKHNLQFKE